MDVLISPDALGKQAQLTYEGKSYKLLLAYRNGAVLTQNSLMSAWNAVHYPYLLTVYLIYTNMRSRNLSAAFTRGLCGSESEGPRELVPVARL